MEAIRSIPLSTSVISLIGLWLLYRVAILLYNISPLHPLSRFPGPKRATCSYVYEAYYDWWLVGRYGRKIKEMHDVYGPIVRINPDELHCNDPLFTDEIYASGGRIRDKWAHQMARGAVGPVTEAGLNTVSHELHRKRKGAFNRFFSKQQVIKLEHEVNEFAQRCTDKMLACAGKGAFDVKQAFNCFTADIISQYAFGQPMGFIDQEGWEPNFATWTASQFRMAYLMRYIAPARYLAAFVPAMADYMGEDVKAIMHQMNVVIPGYIHSALKNREHGRVFAELIVSKILPEEEKTVYRLSGEGVVFLIAGTETTSAGLAVITYHLLAKPEVYRRLMEALEGCDTSRLEWTDLERRPYLWAIIQETLRMTPGISHRTARIARDEDLVYRSEDGNVQWVIPRGTPIGMSPIINHWDEKCFPNPSEFIPERWLLDDDGHPNHGLEKRLMAFGRGSRDCLGRQLAYCELFVMTAMMALKVLPRARLHEMMTQEDITYDHDMVVPQTTKGNISVRIAISRLRASALLTQYLQGGFSDFAHRK
ncbi:benzoate 4-monooxygenase cytochrome P450 [Xylariomycetidae sp. FL2044]|nr:benzoate 4-monooxygenase cytochrome P450 [Xylariomycetidae sp. FL2044]